MIVGFGGGEFVVMWTVVMWTVVTEVGKGISGVSDGCGVSSVLVGSSVCVDNIQDLACYCEYTYVSISCVLSCCFVLWKRLNGSARGEDESIGAF